MFAMQALRVVEGQLTRVTREVMWRGLVATGLAGLLYSSWANAGEPAPASLSMLHCWS